MFQANPCLLNCCHAITLANNQPKPAYPVNNHIRYVHGLALGVQRYGDVRELENLFGGGEYSRDWVLRMVL